jgi:hypothetical protein
MNSYGGDEGVTYAFLTWEMYGGEWLVSRFSYFTHLRVPID